MESFASRFGATFGWDDAQSVVFRRMTEGSACPCKSSAPAQGSYNPQYHRDHPAPATEDCGGTGYIGKTFANTTESVMVIEKADYNAISGGPLAFLAELMAEGPRETSDILIVGKTTGCMASITVDTDSAQWNSTWYRFLEVPHLVGGIVYVAPLDKKAT
jgi:hypothetical protein